MPKKVMDQIIPETISRHTEDRKVTGCSQHGFMKRESCLTKLVTFYREITGSVNEGRTVNVAYFDFSKAP